MKRIGLKDLIVFAAVNIGCILILVLLHRIPRGPADTVTPSPSIHTAVARADWASPCQVVPEVPTWDEFYDYVEQHSHCNKMEIHGGIPNSDGHKSICMDPGFGIQRNNCTVLSFGINNDFSFDDAMADKMGCDVYAFDPSMSQQDHLRGQRVRFFDLGLGPQLGFGSVKRAWMDEPLTLKVDSYYGILKRLNLLNSIIDYLKVDIEEAELYFFRNIREHPELLANIKQIGMEIHPGRDNPVLRDEFWQHIHHLRCLQFRPVSSLITDGNENLYRIGKRRVSAAYEIVWVNDAYTPHL